MMASIDLQLQALARQDLIDGIRSKFASDPERTNRFGFEYDEIYFDFNKTHISNELKSVYQEYATNINFSEKRHQLFSGVKINSTEQRSVLHMLLRDSTNQGIVVDEPDAILEAQNAERQFIQSYEQIIAELEVRDEPVRDIIHVGIGGSSLGTQLLFESLVDLGAAIKVHFISNIDAHKLVTVLKHCHPKHTLVVGVSKTFTTAETLQNINTIGDWFQAQGNHAWMNEVYAVTSKPENALAFGVYDEHVVGFPEWVGGRYSVWSSVSLSAAVALGIDKFKAFLSGAASMDKHFYNADVSENICFIAAALDHYYANYLKVKSRAIFAYDHRLRSLVTYLQQLETESNGKDRQTDGTLVDQSTSVVVWGGVGTDVQHSVFQMLHQGTSLIPSEFILVKQPGHDRIDHHKELLANGLAQSAALLAGQDIEKVKELNAKKGLSDITLKAKVFSGNRPSTTILMKTLSPYNLGGLLAFYEHRTFCGGLFANINSFDQMGVELGKRLAKSIKPLLCSKDERVLEESRKDFDPSTLDLVSRVLD